MKKILVIQTAFPGDAILTLPMIQKLNEEDSDAIIDVLCIPQTKIFFENSDCVQSVIVYDKREKDKSLINFIKLIRKIKKNKYDLIVSPHRSLRSTLLTYFSSAKQTISFDKSAFSFLYKKTIIYNETHHEVQRNLSLIEYEVNDWNENLPIITINERVQERIKNLISEKLLKNYVVVAPGSVWETKKYPIEYFSKVIDYLLINNYQIVLIGSEQDKNNINHLLNKNKNVVTFMGELNFIESIEVIKHSKLLICNDSAPTHMGMVANVPTLTIYCSTVPEFGFYPYNGISQTVSLSIDCKPCGIHGHNKCPKGHYNCAILLEPEIVIEKINDMLKQN